jgi:hypothetical protein
MHSQMKRARGVVKGEKKAQKGLGLDFTPSDLAQPCNITTEPIDAVREATVDHRLSNPLSFFHH